MEHLPLLRRLLPQEGYDPAAPRLARSLACEGRELDRVQANAQAALGALDPFSFPEWMTAWENVYALPDPCARPGQTLQERVAFLALAFQEHAGISRAWLARYALLVGQKAEILEYRPFCAGASRAGDPLSNGSWRHAFLTRVRTRAVYRFRAGRSQCGETLVSWRDGPLECVIRRRKPAHCAVLFQYLDA